MVSSRSCVSLWLVRHNYIKSVFMSFNYLLINKLKTKYNCLYLFIF